MIIFNMFGSFSTKILVPAKGDLWNISIIFGITVD